MPTPTKREKSAENEVDKNKKRADNDSTNEEGRVIVTGNEFGEYADIKELRAKAIQYYKDNLQGTSVENPVLGKIDIDQNGIVNFTGAGKREMKNSSAKEHKLLLIKHLPQLIKNATNIVGKNSSKDKHDGEYFYYLHTTATINGQRTPVNITLVKRNDSSIQYYNHTLPSEENQKDAVVSTGPESSNEALGTPSIPASNLDDNIPQKAEKHKKNLPCKPTNLPSKVDKKREKSAEEKEVI